MKNAALKDAANRALGYARPMKEEQLEVVVLFLSESLCYACLPFAFELLGETEDKPIWWWLLFIDCHHEVVTYLSTLNYINVIHILPVCTSPNIV